MSSSKPILLFLSALVFIYLLRFWGHNSAPSPIRRFLGALENKYCSSDASKSQPTSSDIANAADFREQFFSTMRNNENKLKTALETSDWVAYVKSLVIPSIVWIIFLGFSIIGWLCYCMCCCCDKQCPPCGFLKRDVQAKPYEGFELWGPILFIVLFGTGILGISAAGIVYSTQVQKGTENTLCTLVTIFDDVVYGTQYNSTQWLGVYPVMDRIDDVIVELSSIPDKFYGTSEFNDITWVDSGINSLLMENRNIYTKYQASKLSSPNPDYPGDVVPSNFITSYLGPYTKSNTMTESIDTQFQMTSVALSSALKTVYSTSKDVAANAQDISNTLNSSTDQIRTLYDSMKKYEDQINTNLAQPYDYIQQINTGFYVAWALNITAACMGILGGIGVYLFKWQRMRFLLHCSWFLLSALMCIGFILSAVFIPFGIITIEGCDIFDEIITSPTKYTQYTTIIPSDINSKLQTCLFGSGNLLTEFGINDQVDQLNSISTSANNLSNINSNNYSLSSSDILMEKWRTTTNSLQYGLIADSDETNNNNSFVSIENFNKWSDFSVTASFQAVTCQETQDNWVFNYSNCSYTLQWNSGNAATDLKGTQVCMQINDFDTTSVDSRYSSLSSTCSSSVGENNIKYFASLKNYDNSRRNLFSGISNSLTNLMTSNDNFNNKIIAFNQTMYSFLANIESFIGNVSDEKNGLINGFNCAFVRNLARDSYNSMCVSFFTPIYLQTIFIATTSLLMFLMSLLAYLAGMRFGKIGKMGDVEDDPWGKN